MNWAIEGVIICFVFYESVVFSIHRQLQQASPNVNVWFMLAAKGLKLILTAVGILLVRQFTEIPFKRFALITVAIYFVSVIAETIFFLKKKQNE